LELDLLAVAQAAEEGAIRDARADAAAELQAKSRRLRQLITEVEGRLQDLDKRTSGDLRLRLDGLWLLLLGISFTTWPHGIADNLLGWLPGPIFYLALVGYMAWRLIGSTTRALRSD
jgi:hypothetical protein